MANPSKSRPSRRSEAGSGTAAGVPGGGVVTLDTSVTAGAVVEVARGTGGGGIRFSENDSKPRSPAGVPGGLQSGDRAAGAPMQAMIRSGNGPNGGG